MSFNAQVALTLTFARPETPGSNDFEVLTSALASYQASLLQQAQETKEEELRPSIIQDALTANGLLCQLLNQGFNEVFNQRFYDNNNQ